MILTVNTQLLKEMVNKAIKGAGMNRLLPITNMMLIEIADNKLNLLTTDGTSTLVIKTDKCETADDFYVVVPIDIFSKLINKTTCESVILNLEENNLLVKGNGSYRIPLPLDEEGLVKFPKPKDIEVAEDKNEIIKNSFIKSVINTNKASVAKTLEIPCLTGYYVGEEIVVSSDENNACYNKINLFNDNVLVSTKVLDLLALSNYEEIKYVRKQNYLMFFAEDLTLYTQELEGKDIFPIEPLMELYNNSTFKSSCKVPKILLQSVIDRLMLFIEPYDKNAVTFTFTQNGLQISSRKMSGIEVVNYTASEGFEPFIAIVDVVSLKAQIDAYQGEEIEIWYGLSNALKLQNGNITQIISLLEEI